MTIILAMYLSGLVCSICPEIDRRYELSWIWHEKVDGCSSAFEFRNGAKILTLYRPMGLSRQSWIELFGDPESEGKIRFKVDGKITELDVLHYSKNEKYDFELYFDNGICVSCSLTPQVCFDKIHGTKAHKRRPSILNLLRTGTCSQPGYEPNKKYELLVPQY